MNKYTFIKHINRAKLLHNDKYDYFELIVNTFHDKGHIICPIHGEFLMSLELHIRRRFGCPKCESIKNKKTEFFVEKSNKIHGSKYDYSKSFYVNAKTKICIICPEHGEFMQEPRHHLNGSGCPKCAGVLKSNNEDFIDKANLVHNNKYDYSNIVYEGNHKKIKIVCPEHGEFMQDPASHLNGCGCPRCKGGVVSSIEEFINKANEIHNNKYTYITDNYINAHTNVEIICKKHGIFNQSPDAHLRGQGCPKCKSSKLENIVIRYLEKNNIKYVYQYFIGTLGKKSLDFFLPDYNTVIECQGEQHYIPVSFRGCQCTDSDIETFNKRVILDELKYNECINNKHKIIYFTIPSYFHKKDVDIYTLFYKNKTVFTDVENMINYILLIN